jgi:para-nitrobenzyl esterase
MRILAVRGRRVQEVAAVESVVTTRAGRLRGAQCDGLRVFRGVRYAAPVAGALRFAAPVPEPRWDGVRDATLPAPIPPQRVDGLSKRLGILTDREYGEDCLALDLWTPACDAGQRPVLVFLPGGAFATGAGSSPIYDGAALARRGDVVVASVSYRVGALGFLCHPALGADAANRGLLDQLAALRWLREHAARFGGDPNNLTVFGESAGAGSIVSLLALPAARGLFGRAIVQSAAPDGVLDRGEALRRAGSLFDRLRTPGESDAALAARLPALPLGALLDAQQACIEAGPHAKGMFFMPVIDGQLLRERPLDAIGRGSARDVELVIGTTQDEMKLFQLTQPAGFELSEALVEKIVEAQIPGAARDGRTRAARLVDGYRKLLAERGIAISGNELFAAIQTDFSLAIPSAQLARAHAAYQPLTHLYLFTQASPLEGGRLGACHALDLPFVFGTLDAPGAREFAGSDAGARRVSEQLMDAWIAFARSGDPSHAGIGRWEACTPKSLPTMELGPRCGMLAPESPLLASRAIWESL